MNNSITIGQYVKGNSWIYKIDSRFKILAVILIMIGIFFIPISKPLFILIGFGLYFILVLTTRIPLKKVINGLKPLLFMMLFTFVLQVIYVSDGELLTTLNFQIGLYQSLMIVGLFGIYFLTKKFVPFKFLYLVLIIFLVFFVQYYFHFNELVFANYHLDVFDAGVYRGVFLFVRVVLIIGLTSLLTFTTMTTDINNGLESLMSPLKYLHIPVSTFAMLLSLTLRFIPTLLDETNKIMRSQASRGVDFEEGKLKQKIMQIISLLIPMFVLSISRADDLANAMEARGYVIGAKRTKIDEMKIRYYDYLFLIMTILLVGLCFITRYL